MTLRQLRSWSMSRIWIWFGLPLRRTSHSHSTLRLRRTFVEKEARSLWLTSDNHDQQSEENHGLDGARPHVGRVAGLAVADLGRTGSCAVNQCNRFRGGISTGSWDDGRTPRTTWPPLSRTYAARDGV